MRMETALSKYGATPTISILRMCRIHNQILGTIADYEQIHKILKSIRMDIENNTRMERWEATCKVYHMYISRPAPSRGIISLCVFGTDELCRAVNPFSPHSSKVQLMNTHRTESTAVDCCLAKCYPLIPATF